MKENGATTPVDFGPPVVRHVIRGMRLADVPVEGIEVLMHRRIHLEDWRLRNAADAYWRLYWPLDHGGRVSCQGTALALDPGRLYLITPNTAFNSECSGPFSKWYIHFTIGGLNDSGRPAVLALRPTRRMKTLLHRTCPAQPGHQVAGTEAERQLATLELIILALGMAFKSNRLAPENPRLWRCVAFLKERLGEKLTLQDLASFAGIGPRTLSGMFVSELGLPPVRYLMELRLNQAMKLLRYTNHSIEHIAEECGFGNRYYFTRMFAKYRHVTPAAFRNRSGLSLPGRAGTKR